MFTQGSGFGLLNLGQGGHVTGASVVVGIAVVVVVAIVVVDLVVVVVG